MPEQDSGTALVFGCLLDGDGSATLIDLPEAAHWQNHTDPIWLHLDSTHPEAEAWLKGVSGLDHLTIDALLASETRPRILPGRKAVAAILRGINMNAGSDPDDMVALRMWCDGNRLITMRHRRLQTPRDLYDKLIEHGTGPNTIPDLFERLIARLNERMASTVDGLDDELDGLELQLVDGNARAIRQDLAALRMTSVNLRRFLAPQREALSDLRSNPPKWLSENAVSRLHETQDRVTRYLEEIDSARERAAVLKDDATNQIAEKSERTLYVLSMVSAIFLPLGFLTGLLGINVGGVPGLENSSAFALVCIGLMVIVVLQLALMRWMKWL